MASEIALRVPVSEDGLALHRLVAACPPLDPNSVYCNLLHCTHFADTSVAAECDGELLGFISAYRLPESPQTLFVWQVAVAPAGRGQGLAGRMLDHLLVRTSPQAIRYLETTVTAANRASWALFESAALRWGTSLQRLPGFDQDRHFGGVHASECLVRIGPLDASRRRAQSG